MKCVVLSLFHEIGELLLMCSVAAPMRWADELMVHIFSKDAMPLGAHCAEITKDRRLSCRFTASNCVFCVSWRLWLHIKNMMTYEALLFQLRFCFAKLTRSKRSGLVALVTLTVAVDDLNSALFTLIQTLENLDSTALWSCAQFTLNK